MPFLLGQATQSPIETGIYDTISHNCWCRPRRPCLGNVVGTSRPTSSSSRRLDTPGGRTSSLESGTGFRFDLGPTFFLYPRVLADIFSACGYDLNNEVEMVKLDPQYRLIFGSGGDLLATPDLGGWKMPSLAFHPMIAVHLLGS